MKSSPPNLVCKPVTLEAHALLCTCPLVSSYLYKLSTGGGQQMQGAGELPKETLSGSSEASASGPFQELLQASTGLNTPGPMEATQRGPWKGKKG